MLHKANVVPETNASADSKGPQPPVIRSEFTTAPPVPTGTLDSKGDWSVTGRIRFCLEFIQIQS